MGWRDSRCGETVDVLIQDGIIAQLTPSITPDLSCPTMDGQNQLLLPGLVNAHAHIDENIL